MDALKTVVIQPDTRWADRDANRKHLSKLMDRVDAADLFVLPETCTTGFLGDLPDEGEREQGAADLAWVVSESERRGAAVVAGVAVVENGQRFNRLVFATPDGGSTHYDKRHLFGYGGEGDRYSAGDHRVRVAWRGWRFDLQICYDLRFPVWCRNDDAFDVQLFPANWPSPRVEAWRTLLKARAIENQAVVIGVNRCGTDGKGVEYPGSSRAYDALGEPLLELDGAEDVAEFVLDPAAVRGVREKFPFLADRDRYRVE
ncbi:nitrilase-related carbon-nitrogen hydrolase [Halomonas denitrificans]|nr:hypothetical protein [Halomonas denitrificans]